MELEANEIDERAPKWFAIAIAEQYVILANFIILLLNFLVQMRHC